MGGSSSKTTTTPTSVFTGEATQLREQIAAYQALIDNKDGTLATATDKIGGYTKQQVEAQGNYDALKDEITAFDIKGRLQAAQAALDKAKQTYDASQGEIVAASEKTGVQVDLIGDFLRLTQAVVPDVNNQRDQIVLLETYIGIMFTKISRDCREQFYIDEYFNLKDKCKQAIPPLNDAKATRMDDIVCSSVKEYTDNILKLVTDGISKAKTELGEWKDDPSDPDSEEKKETLEKNSEDLTFFDKKFLQASCVTPQDWQADQRTRAKNAQSTLTVMAPPLIKYLGILNKTLLTATHLLASQPKLSEEQTNALKNASPEMVDAAKKELSSITSDAAAATSVEPKKDDGKEDDDEDSKEDDAGTTPSPLSGIKTLVNNKDMQNAFEQNAILMATVKTSLAIVESDVMKNLFTEGSAAKLFATSVENICQELMRCMGNVRGELLLASDILKLKPASIDNPLEVKYWDAMNSAIIVMYESSGVVFEAFGSLVTFYSALESSFQTYVSNSDLTYLTEDLNNFAKSKAILFKAFDSLNTSAMESIQKVIENFIGDANFEAARKSVNADLAKYQSEQALFNTKKDEEHAKLLLLKQRAATQKAALDSATIMIAQWNDIKLNAQDTAQIQAKIDALNTKLELPTLDYKTEDITTTED